MPKSRLQDLLGEMEQQIEAEESIDESTRARLVSLKRAIESRLGSKSDESETRASLVEPVRDAIEDFEDSHPTLTLTLGRIMDLLNKLGI